MNTSDFDYHLPSELIAARPPERREDARMMRIDRATGCIEHGSIRDFPGLLRDGDLAVMNDTRVRPARFYSNDHRLEILCLDRRSPLEWVCLVKPGKRMKIGRQIEIGDATGTVTEILEQGERLIVFDREIDSQEHGHLALPPYMNREDEALDRERYQTVFAREEGAIAAPTAGLHFTPEMLTQIPHAFVTLHVGLGTFQPVKVEDLTTHPMHRETYALSPETAAAIRDAQRVIAIGTTVVRVLEHCAAQDGLPLQPGSGSTEIFIYPPYQFKSVGALLTNFHLPRSTLLMLVAAFAGKELMEEAYRSAIAERYRFYSYGDCMFIQ